MITNGNTQQMVKSSPEKPFSNTASAGFSGLTYTVTSLPGGHFHPHLPTKNCRSLLGYN